MAMLWTMQLCSSLRRAIFGTVPAFAEHLTSKFIVRVIATGGAEAGNGQQILFITSSVFIQNQTDVG
jgi:hypothetical protein